MSGVPPGGKVTITRTGLDGKPWAHVADERAASTASATIVLNDISKTPRTTARRISPVHHPVAPPRPLRGHPSLRKEGIEKKKAARFLLWVRLRATNSAHFSCFTASPLFSLAELADGCELCGKRGQLGFDGGDFLLVLGVAPRFLGGLQGLGRLGLVQVAAADRGVGEHGHHLGLHFEDPARDEDQLFLAAAGGLDPHRSGLDARDERRVLGVDAELARFAG